MGVGVSVTTMVAGLASRRTRRFRRGVAP
jgi:hypothetical protein